MPIDPVGPSHSVHPSDDDYSSSEDSTRPPRTQDRTDRLNAQANAILADLCARRRDNPESHGNLTTRRASTLLGIYENRANAGRMSQVQYLQAADYLRRLTSPETEGEDLSSPQPMLSPQQRAFLEGRFPPNLFSRHTRMDENIEFISLTGQGSMVYDPYTSRLSPLHDVDQALRPR
ncbi:hypothetical protein [Xylophilus ampelinus]|uniref:hypothetical protein n=1 Tax=Xylophilus ampelinus TaxID=54067 RepID=UPI0011B7AD3D|nr:hypothetical protein [Xylophilus ampelinus]MCS4509241.1 hypothetical protein [Xylophilus ampelinus]